MNRAYFLILFLLFIFGASALFSCTQSETTKGSGVHLHSEQGIYTCPMHPEIKKNEPGNCPICHMKLVKKKVTIDLQISPYQAELVGIRPIEISKEKVSYTIPVSGRILSGSSVALQVFEKDLRYLKKGIKFTGQAEAYSEELLKGEIVSIDNLVDPTSRTIRVVGAFQNGEKKLLVESSFNGEILVDLGSQIVIPEKAVLFTGKGHFVYLFEDHTLHPRKVVLGPKVSESYVVLSGLDEGSKISSGPNFLIDSESKIRGLNDQRHH